MKKALTSAVLLLMFSGCAKLFPSKLIVTESPWRDYEHIRGVFDQIEPNVTTLEDLKNIGFDPEKLPNVSHLNYVAVKNMFLNNSIIRVDDLPKGVRECLASPDECYGYQFSYRNTTERGVGNIWLRWIKYKTEDRLTGSDVSFQVFLKGNLVVYKQHSGTKSINQHSVEIHPLGPLDNPFDIVIEGLKEYGEDQVKKGLPTP